MIVLKEFDDTRRDELSPLEARGYVRGDVPAARQLESNFESFDDYCSALRAPIESRSGNPFANSIAPAARLSISRACRSAMS